MIRKENECKVELREHMRDGNGTVKITHFTSPEELYNKGRLYAKITLEPGCSIGYHEHLTDSEIFYILNGHAKYNDNGEIKDVYGGDVTICAKGQGHGISNETDETIEFIAVIVYA